MSVVREQFRPQVRKKNYIFFVSLMEQIYILIGKSLLSAV